MPQGSDASSSSSRRWLAALAVAVLVTATVGMAPPHWLPVRLLDNVLYDGLYRLRPETSKRDASVVIVSIDQSSLDFMREMRLIDWPWPRKWYGQMVEYFAKAGAKVIVFDMLFEGQSPWGDDDDFAASLGKARVPVIFATQVKANGKTTGVVLPIEEPLLGASNVTDYGVVRTYRPTVQDVPSLAALTVQTTGVMPPGWAAQPFRLQYYGPHAHGDGPVTFHYVRAAAASIAAADPSKPAPPDATPQTFKDKIVLIGGTAAATYDLKVTPVSDQMPGVEVHATAIENMLNNQRVLPVPAALRLLLTFVFALAAALMTIHPQRVLSKLSGALLVPAALFALAVVLFRQHSIRWLPIAAPLTAILVAVVLAFAYSYFTELKLRRFAIKALSQYLSKRVVEQLTNEQLKLALGGQRRTMTVLFSDLMNFTNFSEKLDVEGLTSFLNFYLEHISAVVFENDGTIDKYIGDAVMSFWNAPLDQADHARRTCLTALQMVQREDQMQSELAAQAGAPVHSRIGINTGAMLVGNLGSSKKFNYTVVGDAVNLASRLEGANKMYGTRILVAESTALQVADAFVMRKVDLLRVKGKSEPIGIYQLIGQAPCDPLTAALIERYETALAMYRGRKFDDAERILLDLSRQFPDDGPVASLLSRTRQYLEKPPPAEWDGVYVPHEK